MRRLHPIEPYNVVAKGICHCPEGRKLFSELSVLKNLQLGAYLRKNNADVEKDLERVFTLFPVLRERQWQQSSTLSGGEQQMVAIGRALMGRPELLLLDEPSVGIAPRLKGLIFDSIQQIRKDGTAILIVEQDATSTLRIADRVYVLEHGRTIREGTSAEIAGDKYIQQIYLGVYVHSALLSSSPRRRGSMTSGWLRVRAAELRLSYSNPRATRVYGSSPRRARGYEVPRS